jgi:hypothetical protein
MANNSPEAVAQQNAAMKAQLAHVTSLIEEYTRVSTGFAGKTLTVQEHGQQTGILNAAVRETNKLLHAVKGPLGTVYCHVENVSHLP